MSVGPSRTKPLMVMAWQWIHVDFARSFQGAVGTLTVLNFQYRYRTDQWNLFALTTDHNLLQTSLFNSWKQHIWISLPLMVKWGVSQKQCPSLTLWFAIVPFISINDQNLQISSVTLKELKFVVNRCFYRRGVYYRRQLLLAKLQHK